VCRRNESQPPARFGRQLMSLEPIEKTSDVSSEVLAYAQQVGKVFATAVYPAASEAGLIVMGKSGATDSCRHHRANRSRMGGQAHIPHDVALEDYEITRFDHAPRIADAAGKLFGVAATFDNSPKPRDRPDVDVVASP